MSDEPAVRRKEGRWERLKPLEDYENLSRARLAHVVPVDQPLVLVSQVQRSGSTLLGQLFDGHPEAHAHPYELRIGPRGHTYDWPVLDLAAPEEWFDALYEQKAGLHLEEGYRTSSTSSERFPFVFLPRLQKRIFDGRARKATTEREVLDAYFTAYFNAWLDNHNLYTGPKRIVFGTTPRLVLDPANVERYFAAYPDGTLVSAVRHPAGWLRSAAKKYGYEGDAEALALWRGSAEATLAARERYGDRVVVVTFERLVEETEASMRRIAERVGISWHDSLAVPTFNGRPIRANSSFPVAEPGILRDRAGAGTGRPTSCTSRPASSSGRASSRPSARAGSAAGRSR